MAFLLLPKVYELHVSDYHFSMEGERLLWALAEITVSCLHVLLLCVSKRAAYVARGCRQNLGTATACYRQDTLAVLMFMVL